MAMSATIILPTTLCFLSLFGSAYCGVNTEIFGTVYCDNCKLRVKTPKDEPLSDAMVALQCKDKDGKVTWTGKTTTDDKGHYSWHLLGYENIECAITLVDSNNPKCNEISSQVSPQVINFDVQASSKVIDASGKVQPTTMRYVATPMGFQPKEEAPGCKDILKTKRRE